MSTIDMIGKRFNRFVVLEYVDSRQKNRHYRCRCDCWKESIVNGKYLRYWRTKSCGCYKKDNPWGKTHWMSGVNQFYNTRQSMKQRCYYENHIWYHNWGWRWIKICDAWKNSFLAFKEDMFNWYLEHIRKYGKKNTSLDRIDSNGLYCKENCRRATKEEQSNNIRKNVFITYWWMTKTLSQRARYLGLHTSTVSQRYRKGCSPKDILRNADGSLSTLLTTDEWDFLGIKGL